MEKRNRRKRNCCAVGLVITLPARKLIIELASSALLDPPRLNRQVLDNSSPLCLFDVQSGRIAKALSVPLQSTATDLSKKNSALSLSPSFLHINE